ncbi:MAG: helix-turn-helix transcriptional regulator [Pseudomonadota bacterium]|jgi:DNA-binding transcriptional ArsR family regulator
MESTDVVQALTGLAQASRLSLFRALVQAGAEGMQPTALALRLEIPANTLSFHLKTLMMAKLITQEKQGRGLVYRVDFAYTNRLLGFLTANCCGGEACAVQPLQQADEHRRNFLQS